MTDEQKIYRVVIPEINEIRLVHELAQLTRDWVKTLRFTKETSSEKNITDKDRSTAPTVYEFDFPKFKVQAKDSNLPVGMLNADLVVERRQNKVDEEDGFAPAVIIRSGETDIGIDDDGDYEDANIDFHIQVSEFDVVLRHTNLILAKNAIIQGLRSMRGRTASFGYRMDWNISTHPSDDENEPKAMMVISTKWRRYLSPLARQSLDEIQ